MSLKGAEIFKTLDELQTSNPNLKSQNNIAALDYLNINKFFHKKILYSISKNISNKIAYNNQDENDMNPSNLFRDKIKYKSNLKIDKLNKIINLDIFNNITSNKSIELLNNFQNKANNIINKSKKVQENEININNDINIEKEDDKVNINSYFERKNKIKNNFNANKSQDKISYGGGSYMDIRPVNGKRKKYNSNDDDNDDEENENKNGYSAYTNSIYNINKKKKIKENIKIIMMTMKKMKMMNLIIITIKEHIIINITKKEIIKIIDTMLQMIMKMKKIIIKIILFHLQEVDSFQQ